MPWPVPYWIRVLDLIWTTPYYVASSRPLKATNGLTLGHRQLISKVVFGLAFSAILRCGPGGLAGMNDDPI